MVVHRSRSLHPEECTVVDGLPITSPSLTLLDLAEVQSLDRFERIFEEATRLEVIDMRALEATMARHPGRHGLKPLRSVVAGLGPIKQIKSELERDFVDLYRDAGFPEPECNVLVGGFVVDFWWPQAQLVVEIDSRRFHAHWEAAERDRARDAKLLRLGIATLRLTYRRLRNEREEIAADLNARFRMFAGGVEAQPPPGGSR